MTNQQHQSDTEAEISLIDILRFLKSAWKEIAIFGLAGIALSIAYLAITPQAIRGERPNRHGANWRHKLQQQH
jgi:uncharacterized protein involved in exopolysaccharide biosynthesis